MRVVKLGGSVAQNRVTKEDLEGCLLNSQGVRDHQQDLVICGGGKFADVVREYHAIQQFGNRLSHELAIRSMTLMTHWVGAVTSWPIVEARDLLRRSSSDRGEYESQFEVGSVILVDCTSWLLETGGQLPVSWEVTSDSIAAQFALLIDAPLLLVKSTPLSVDLTWEQRAAKGLVDEHFPKLVRNLRGVEWQVFGE